MRGLTRPSPLRRPPPNLSKLLRDLLALHPLSSRKFGIIRISERYADILLGALDVRNEAINHHHLKCASNPIKQGADAFFVSVGIPVENTVEYNAVQRRKCVESAYTNAYALT